MNTDTSTDANADSVRDYPALECPICDKSRNPKRLNKDGSVVYECSHNEKWQEGRPLYKTHNHTYKWKILADGTMVE
ncbi:MAG: hypothetical protein CMK74_03845 [Pseudomonadales bacterium]|nr:hypothetical protein [Pseudomonadales bacterium]|tara:strand:- start:347 stop:577 length:231 start_codon:yes stop_codon:yes gene_type:complete